MITDLETNSLIEEYKSLRSEIAQRVNYQTLIMAGELALISGTLGLVSQSYSVDKLTFLLFAPLIFIVISWLFLEQDVFIAQAASYLHQDLRPLIIRRIAQEARPPQAEISVMRWEAFRKEELFGTRKKQLNFWVTTIFRALATIGPAAVLIGAVMLIKPEVYKDLTPLQDTLLGIDLALIVFLCYQYWSVYQRLYRGITGA